jgi:hypothetical protein
MHDFRPEKRSCGRQPIFCVIFLPGWNASPAAKAAQVVRPDSRAAPAPDSRTDHIPGFSKRGLCARDPKHALADDIAMRMPRKGVNDDAFKP